MSTMTEFILDEEDDEKEVDTSTETSEEDGAEDAADLLEDEDEEPSKDGKKADAKEDDAEDEDEDGVLADSKNKSRFEKRLKREVYLRREAQRQTDEALKYAKQVLEDRRKDRQIAHIATKAYAEESVQSVEALMKSAEAEYLKAYEDADAIKIVEAQKKLASLAVRQEKAAERVERLKSAPDPTEEDDTETHFQPPRRGPDEKTLLWQEKNSWYGKDDAMTAVAWTIHQRLATKGIYGNSDAYWTLLDKGMRESFPHKFEAPKKTTSNPTSVVAGVTRRSAAGSQRSLQLTPSQKHVAKRLGLTDQQYLEELKKMEA